MANKNQHTTARDLAGLINNALIGWRNCLYFKDLRDKYGQSKLDARMARLRAYMEAHYEPIKGDLDEGLLDPSEAAYVLLAELTMLTGTRLRGANKTPAFADLSARILEDSEVVDEEDD